MKSRALLLYNAIYIGFHGGSVVKNLPVNAGDMGLIPELGKSPAEGNSNPFQYSILENPMSRGQGWEIRWQRCWQHALIARGASGRRWGLCGGQKERKELGGEGRKDTLYAGVGVHRTSVLQEHSGVDRQPAAAGAPEGEVQGGRLWLERRRIFCYTLQQNYKGRFYVYSLIS